VKEIYASRDCDWCGDTYQYRKIAGGFHPQRCAVCTGYATTGGDLYHDVRLAARILKDLLLVKRAV
jgi:hypothetical protein